MFRLEPKVAFLREIPAHYSSRKKSNIDMKMGAKEFNKDESCIFLSPNYLYTRIFLSLELVLPTLVAARVLS